MKLIPLYLSLFLIAACSSEPNAGVAVQTPQSVNPLDEILGDKVIDGDSNEIRANNFSKLLSLNESDLENPSTLYEVRGFGDNYKILKQKKAYSKARNFTIILALENRSVSQYHVLNDLLIEDALQNSEGVYLLAGDLENQNDYWKSDNKVELIKLDSNLNEVQKYSVKSDQYPLSAGALINENGTLNATIDVITGCSICTNTFKLTFNDSLHCISAIEIAKTHSRVTLSPEFIQDTFIQ